MSLRAIFTCDGCGATTSGVPGEYELPEPPRGWTWFWGSHLRATGPHACSQACWSKVGRNSDGKPFLPDSHELREREGFLKIAPQAESLTVESQPRVAARRPLEPLVYFIQRGEAGPVKIGYSKNPRGRLSSLQSGFPEKLRILGVLSGGKDEEQRLHRFFGAHWIKGEWFNPAPDLVNYILKHGRAP